MTRIRKACYTYVPTSMLPLAQKGRFVMKPVFLGGGTMVPTGNISDFRLFESSKNELSRTFCSPNLSIER